MRIIFRGDNMCTVSQLQIISDCISKEYRRVYGADIADMYLFGSYARNEETDQSDIDYAAIVHGERPELQERLKKVWNAAADIGLQYDVVVSPTVIPYDEFQKYKEILPYYRNISIEGKHIG